MIKWEKNKKNFEFLVGLFLFAIIDILFSFRHTMNPQDTTVFAFSYKYGFISRGLAGTCLKILDMLLPGNQMTYGTIYTISEIVTVIFFICLFALFYICLKKCQDDEQAMIKYMIIFMSIFAFPEFLTLENFGRLDVYLTIIILICTALILSEKFEWCIVPLCALGTIIHQGFVFMDVNLVLVLLFYKALRSEGKKRKKYTLILILSFIVCSIFFLYFEIFSHSLGQDAYNEIRTLALQLSSDGESVNESILLHEILREDVFEYEKGFHILNYQETPLFLLFFSPYIVIAIKFFRNLLGDARTKEDKLVCWAIILGAVTVLPEIVLKIDYGRYVYTIIFYYIAIIMCMITMREKIIIDTLNHTLQSVKNKIAFWQIILIYPILLVPFLDVRFNDLICAIMRWVFGIA